VGTATTALLPLSLHDALPICMPETTLGVAPAQIAPFVVKRIGLTRARQLALTAERFDGRKAYEYGIAQYFATDSEVDKVLEEVVDRKSTRLNSSHVNIPYAVF